MIRRLISIILFLVLITGFSYGKDKTNLYVADRKTECAGSFECIQVKEKVKGPWRVYSDTIEGFNYEEGYEYKILVQPLQTKNTLSGLFEEKYKLLKVISKKKTGYDPIEKLADKKWILQSLYDGKRSFAIKDTGIFIRFNLKDGKISGKNVCNGFTGVFSITGAKISITSIASTKMLCKGEEFEQAIFEFYKKLISYKASDSQLVVYQLDGSYMVFEAR